MARGSVRQHHDHHPSGARSLRAYRFNHAGQALLANTLFGRGWQQFVEPRADNRRQFFFVKTKRMAAVIETQRQFLVLQLLQFVPAGGRYQCQRLDRCRFLTEQTDLRCRPAFLIGGKRIWVGIVVALSLLVGGQFLIG